MRHEKQIHWEFFQRPSGKISLLGTDAHYFSTFDEIEDFLLENCVPQDLLITMGAGDVYKIGEHLLGL